MTTPDLLLPIVEKPNEAETPPFLAGDIILFAGEDDLYSKVGGWLMRGEQEGPTYAVHTAQFINSQQVLEMDFVAKLKSLDDVLNRRYKLDMWKRRGFEVWRCLQLTGAQREALNEVALSYLNVKFSMLRFLAHLLDNLMCKAARRNIYFFRRFEPEDRHPVCSGITASVYDRALHYRFGVEPACADPDHIHDWLTGHPVNGFASIAWRSTPSRPWARMCRIPASAEKFQN